MLECSQPMPPPEGQEDCPDSDDVGHHACERDSFGNCRWVWKTCPFGISPLTPFFLLLLLPTYSSGCRDPNMWVAPTYLCSPPNCDNPPPGCSLPLSYGISQFLSRLPHHVTDNFQSVVPTIVVAVSPAFSKITADQNSVPHRLRTATPSRVNLVTGVTKMPSPVDRIVRRLRRVIIFGVRRAMAVCLTLLTVLSALLKTQALVLLPPLCSRCQFLLLSPISPFCLFLRLTYHRLPFGLFEHQMRLLPQLS